MAKDFAIIETGGKQYKVSSGDTLIVEKLAADAGGSVVFDKVLLRASGCNVEIGAPYLAGAKVEAKIEAAVRGKKKIVFKYHSKTRYRKKKGHRQPYSQISVL